MKMFLITKINALINFFRKSRFMIRVSEEGCGHSYSYENAKKAFKTKP